MNKRGQVKTWKQNEFVTTNWLKNTPSKHNHEHEDLP